MKFVASTILFLFLLVFSFQIGIAQNADDSAFISSAKTNAKGLYFNTIGSQAPWMNGRIHIPYNYPFDDSSPFLIDAKFVEGTLTYEGVAYPGVELLYDELSDKLISVTDKGRIELISDHVDEFMIYERKFVRIWKDTVQHMNRGFYEELYAGKTRVLRKNIKKVKEDLVSGIGVVRTVETKPVYIIQTKNQYYYISSKKKLLNSFADKKDELQKFISHNKLGWKKDVERLITETARYYDQLTK